MNKEYIHQGEYPDLECPGCGKIVPVLLKLHNFLFGNEDMCYCHDCYWDLYEECDDIMLSIDKLGILVDDAEEAKQNNTESVE